MLYWSIVSLVVAAIAGSFGVGVTGTSIGLAQVVAIVLAIFMAISALASVMRRVR
ncbi:DUF1328 domain-containing protein [Shinella sumterensis]|uniref:DUF1328 domain-containing protein n=1 Tax=Shinella sumterensis TaxID=1967501 RepID=UPI003F84F340